LSDPIPQGMTADRKKATLSIIWSEDKECVYPFDLLRSACPCAQCRGGHENMTPEPEDDVFIIPLMNVSTVSLVNIESVGNYAISIEWGDGHNYGIYNWDYLYALCEKMND
jgi:DUF971 family protein